MQGERAGFKGRQEKKAQIQIHSPKPLEIRQICQTKIALMKGVKIYQNRNPPEINSPLEIYVARQLTFKSAWYFQIWWTNPPSGNAGPRSSFSQPVRSAILAGRTLTSVSAAI
jgi:hypothetical protein